MVEEVLSLLKAMELFILCGFWRSLWTKAVVFHLTCSLRLTPHRMETTSPGGERVAAPETDFQLGELAGIKINSYS